MALKGPIHTTGVKFARFESELHGWLVDHAVAILRVSIGAVFLAFGVLKFFPDVSPAQDLAETTFGKLSFGLIPGGVAIVGIAALECFIGICLLLNRWMRLAMWLLVFELVGVLSPIALLPARLFAGPGHAPTLEGQYVIKDVILVAAAMVVAAGTFRKGRMIREDPHLPFAPEHASIDAKRKLEIILSASNGQTDVERACAANGISEGDFYDWRDQALQGAGEALERAEQGATGVNDLRRDLASAIHDDN